MYRLTSFDQLSVEYEIFAHQCYSPALGSEPVDTFVDLGCNAGWFGLWLASLHRSSELHGLLIDAHPRMVDEAKWHLKHNGLSNCFVVHGAVGLPPEETSTIFYIHPSSSASSVLPYEPKRQVLVKGRIAAVTVPTVSVADQWLRRFGQAQVDIMKVDIEGKELDFVSNEGSFLQKFVRKLVIEWHKWHVDLTNMAGILESLGFEQTGVYDENQVAGLASYRNLRLRVRT